MTELDAPAERKLPSWSASWGMSAFSFPLPLSVNLPSLCLEDTGGPLAVWGRGGREAVRVRDMNSPSLLVRFEGSGVVRSLLGDGPCGGCCLSCEVEKRFALARVGMEEFISRSWGGVYCSIGLRHKGFVWAHRASGRVIAMMFAVHVSRGEPPRQMITYLQTRAENDMGGTGSPSQTASKACVEDERDGWHSVGSLPANLGECGEISSKSGIRKLNFPG